VLYAVIEQLLAMKLRPCENQPPLLPAKAAVDDLDLVDPDSRAPIRVPGMEVWAAMVVVVHRDRDPEEAADSRHVLDVDEGAGRIRTATSAGRSRRQPRSRLRSRASSIPITSPPAPAAPCSAVKAELTPTTPTGVCLLVGG
jgi:hypothetical protein